MAFFRRKKSKSGSHKKPRVEKTIFGQKVVIDYGKKARQLRDRDAPFVLDDRQRAPTMELLKELYQYRFTVPSIPQDLKSEIIYRIDKSFTLVDIEAIGGEGAIFGVTDLSGRKLCVKIALPFAQAAGRRTIEEIEEEEKNVRRKKKLIRDLNEFKERFTLGAALQQEVYAHLIDEGVNFFGVPSAKISSDPVLHVVMDWIHGPCLLKRSNRELKYTLQVYTQILDAVSYLHDFGIIHRDLKAENIIIARRGKNDCIFLIDWALAKRAGDRSLTCAGTGIGTIPNASPKQMALRDALHATFLDDIFSLGVLLYEIIYCKKAPRMLREADFQDLDKLSLYFSRMVELIPGVLRPIFEKATQINETQRFQSVREMKMAVLGALSQIDFDTTAEFIDVDAAKTSILDDLAETQQKSEDEGPPPQKNIVFECCGRHKVCQKYQICQKCLALLQTLREMED